MANDIKINLDLTGEQQVNRGLQRTAGNLEDTGDAAKKAGRGLDQMAKDAGHLDRRLAELRSGAKALIAQFNVTGDKSLLPDIEAANREASQLAKLRKQLFDPGDDGGKIKKKFGESLTEAMMALRGPAIGVAIGGAIALSPAIGAAISAAALGGAGAGGIIGGVVAASQDQRVQDAAKTMGRRIGDSLMEAGKPFVQPIIESLRLLDEAGDRVGAKFEEAGAKIAPTLVPLTEGVIGLVEEAMPGFIKALDSAKPVIRAIGNEMPKIGAAISGFFDDISEDSDGAVMAIVGISQAIRGTLNVAGELISTLSSTYEWLIRTGASMSEEWESLFGWMPVAGSAIREAGASYREQVAALDAAKDSSGDYAGSVERIIRAEEEVAKVTKTATEAIDDQIRAMDKMFDRMMGAQDLTIEYQEAIDNLTESVKENGNSLDPKDKAGRENLRALRTEADAIKAIRNDIIQRTGDVGFADTSFNQMVEALRTQALQLGLNKKAVEEFIAALRGIPAQADVEVRAPGLQDAIDRARLLTRLLGGTAAGARARTITIDGNVYAGDTSGYGGGRASGGPVYAGQTYVVGENGPEVLQMGSSGGQVYNASQTRAMMSGGTWGAQPLQVAVQLGWRPGATGFQRMVEDSLQVTATVVGGGTLANATDRGGGPL